jgi:hypothetical protein
MEIGQPTGVMKAGGRPPAQGWSADILVRHDSFTTPEADKNVRGPGTHFIAPAFHCSARPKR